MSYLEIVGHLFFFLKKKNPTVKLQLSGAGSQYGLHWAARSSERVRIFLEPRWGD